jgi:3'-phosphoadenosine 5'-phosphosulfate sulfotransferase (PAPS reductase)/FAD synthetase
MIERNMPIDEIIFCDTGKEFPEMYDHIIKVKSMIGDIKFTELKSEKSFDYYMFEHIITHRDKSRGTTKGYAWPRMGSRWCTTLLKINVIKKYINKLSKQFNIIEYHGIAHDEQARILKNDDGRNIRYPLDELEIVEAVALQNCYDRGFDWNGLYEIFDRVSCWCCPLKKISEIKALEKHKPKLFKELLEMDNKSWNTFRINESVQDISNRPVQITLFD